MALHNPVLAHPCKDDASEKDTTASMDHLRLPSVRVTPRPYIGCREVLAGAFEGLLGHRDFLGHQLDHAFGNISDDELEARADEYFGRQGLPPELLEAAMQILDEQVSIRFEPDVIEAMFNCTHEEAIRAYHGRKQTFPTLTAHDGDSA